MDDAVRDGGILRQRARMVILTAVFAGALGACADLPSSGPTAVEIEKHQKSASNVLHYNIVEIEPGAPQSAPPPRLDTLVALRRPDGPARVDEIGPGDLLQIGVFEVGATLFSGVSASAGASALSSGAGGGLPPPTAAGENLPTVVVDRDGTVNLPYVGAIHVAGHTPEQLQTMIAEGLKGKSQLPQVIVTVRENVANTYVVIGDVKKPGRLPLSLPGDHVLDAVAAAGGPSEATPDMVVRLTRDGHSVEERLDQITAGSPDDIPLAPQDRLEVNYSPRTFTVFGATGKVSEVPFSSPRVSLAEAIARVGGPSDQQADPSAIFVFRYEVGAPADPHVERRPVIYRLNMADPQSYFLAQTFEMRSRDVIYIANARSNQPAKLLQILNLLISPFYSAKIAAQ